MILKTNFLFCCLLTENHKFTETAAELLKTSTDELMLMKGCANCYDHKCSSPDDWMVKTCDQPHLILWIDIGNIDFWPSHKGYRYWPAKVFGLIDDQRLRIMFFGHHEFEKIDIKDCYLYSGQNPNPVNLTSDPRDIAGALEVILPHL